MKRGVDLLGVHSRRDPKPVQGEELLLLLNRAKAGDMDARERLISSYSPFILKVGSQVSGRYIRAGMDDEYSIGLLAFNEAIDGYRPGESNFLAFAAMIIRRRLIDYFRQKKPEVPFSSVVEGENGEQIQIEGKRGVYLEVTDASESIERREEIYRYKDALSEFGISFKDLVACSPKHYDARERAKEVALRIAEDEELRDYLIARKSLPVQKLGELGIVSRKTLERQRKYIIALALIMSGDYPYLREYVAPKTTPRMRSQER